MLGGIAGQNKSTLRNNLVVNAIIPVASEGYGAIVGNNSGSLANNYYYNCTVDNTPKATDANGRLLKESTTQTDRDEIRLGSPSGIVIVIIGGKAYKIMY